MRRHTYFNCYRILEVDPKASREVIEKAFKALSMKHHPDINSIRDKSISEQEMQLIIKAYNILRDKKSRDNYDRTLKRVKLDILLSEGIIGLINFRRSKVLEIESSWY